MWQLPNIVFEPKYFRWVEQVMSSHKAPVIDEFKLQYNLHSDRNVSVDNWVRSAMEKQVKRFQLDIIEARDFDWYSGSWEDGYKEQPFYTLPSLSLSNSLTSLKLSGLDVSGEVLEKLLHDCPLEFLSVHNSRLLVNLKVFGPSLKLKTLKLTLCKISDLEISDLEISAPNLTSFVYSGAILDFPFESIPKLTEFSIGGEYAKHVMYDFSSLSSYASQIEALTLEADYFVVENITVAKAFPVCARLKVLDITICPKFDDQLFGLLSLINACPLLHKFVLQFLAYTLEVDKRTEETENVVACPHPCLKIVEIIGFVGGEVDFGFAEYLIENAVSLEKIIIEPSKYETMEESLLEEKKIRDAQQASGLSPRLHDWVARQIRNKTREERKRRAIQRAEQLRLKLNPGTELQIRLPKLETKWPTVF